MRRGLAVSPIQAFATSANVFTPLQRKRWGGFGSNRPSARRSPWPTKAKAGICFVTHVLTSVRSTPKEPSRCREIHCDPLNGCASSTIHASRCFDAVAQLLIEAESFNDDSLASAVAYRDAALLAFLVLVPLRAKNVKALTVGSSRKNVWFEGDLMYVSISSKLLKNGKRLGNLEVDGISSELTEAIRLYIEFGRPRLVRNSTTDLLFVGSRDSDVMWDTVSPRVRQLTRRFLAKWVPDGLPIHTFRHLVATRFLQLYPGDYVGAAALLHDRLQTVLKTYAPKDPTGAIKKNAQRGPRRRAHLRVPDGSADANVRTH